MASVLSAVLLAVVVLAGSAAGTQHQCAHGRFHNELVPGVRLSSSRARRAVATEGMNVFVHYDTSVESGLNAAVKEAIQMTYIPQVTEFLRNTLKVKAQVSTILNDQTCTTTSFFLPAGGSDARRCAAQCNDTTVCGTVTVPAAHLKECVECNNGGSGACMTRPGSVAGPGVSGHDYILYVSAKQSECGSISGPSVTLLAFAGVCQMESSLDRPVSGYVNFCPTAITNSDDKFVFSVAKHEILHAIAFSESLFPFWRDSTGDPRTTRDANGFPPIVDGRRPAGETTIMPVTYSDWDTFGGQVEHNVSFMVTENVVREVRDHFNCSSLPGAEVENQGGSGTALNHWEQRAFNSEAMTGQFTFNPGFSRITYAALQDTGWYVVNYSSADELLWGRGKGCSFAEDSCLKYITDQQNSGESISPYCNNQQGNGIPLQLGCTLDRLAASKCNLVAFSDVPAEYEYFSNPNIGGSVTIGDFCPFQQIFEYVGGRGTDCRTVSNGLASIDNNLLETYGSSSRCFEHGGSWTRTGGGTFNPSYGGGCYQFSCSSEGGVKVYIGDVPYNCSCAGEKLIIDVVTATNRRYQGSILCPACSVICHDQLDLCPTPEPAPCPGRVTRRNGTTEVTVTDPPTMGTQATPPDSGHHPSAHWGLLAVAVVMATLLRSQ